MRILFAFFVLTTPGIVAAQSPELIVTGKPLAEPKSDAAYDIITIDRERITKSASGRIEDVLKDIAGLAQFRRTDARSANATSQGATLRGLGGNASSRALLVLDGVPQSDPFGGWITWPAFGPERIGQIRVTRGGGSGAFGSGALAGTIDMASIGPQERSSASIVYGSRNAVEANGILAAALGRGHGFLSASYARGDGFIPIIKSQRGSADQAAPYEQASIAGRAVIALDSNTEVQASALAFTDRRTRGTILSENGGDGADASLRIVHQGRWGWSALTYIQARKFQSRFVSINSLRDTVTQTVDQYNVPSTGLGTRVELRPPLREHLELLLGGDWRRTSGETRELFTYVAGNPTRGRLGGGDSDTLGAYAELTATMGGLTLTGSGRIDRWTINNGHLQERTLSTGALLRDDMFTDRSGSEPTGRAGFSYQTGALKLRGAAYIGWRLPTLNELYRPFRVGTDATAANAGLSPERMNGIEAGLDVKMGDHMGVSATLFSNRLKDAIANVTLGRGPGVFPGVGFVASGGAYRQRQNLDAITSRGLELDLHANAGDWNLTASYAYTDAKVRASGVALPLHGLRPAQVAKHNGSATLGWKWISATARYVSGQFEDDQNLRVLGDAVTIDAVVNVPLTDDFTLSLRGENITNTRVEAAISAAGVIERATPRTLWIGLTYGR